MKRLLDFTSRNIDVGQVAQHLFLQYLFFRGFFKIKTAHWLHIVKALQMFDIFVCCLLLRCDRKGVHPSVNGYIRLCRSFSRALGWLMMK
jgi:hypothetical protein